MKEYEIRYVDAFAVVGLQARTNNADETDPARSKIGELWGRVLGEGLLSRIPNTDPSRIVSVYTAYQTDQDGDYIVIVGARSNAHGPPPDGLSVVHVPAGCYAVFSGSGPQPATTVAVWKRVWEYFGSRNDLRRSYTTDFEDYSGDTVEVHVSVTG